MSLGRDARIVLLVSVVGIVLTFSALFTVNERIRNWQIDFASSGEDPVFFSASLFLEHNRLIQAMASFVRGDPQVSKADVLDRLDVYWSRYELLNSSQHLYDSPNVAKSMSWLPPDSHSEILSSSLNTITLELMPALQKVEQQIIELQQGDYQRYFRTRAVMDAYGDSLAKLQIASFERQRYLDDVQVALSEQLRSQLRNALLGISAGIILLSYVCMLYLRQRHNATAEATRH